MREYVELEEAAQVVGRTRKDLLQLAADGELVICVVPNVTWRLTASVVQRYDRSPFISDFHVAQGEISGLLLTTLLLKLSPLSLRNFIAYPDDAVVDVLEPAGEKSPTTQLSVLVPSEGSLIRLSDCHMVVTRKELARLQSVPLPRTMPRKLTKAQRLERDAQRSDTPLAHQPEVAAVQVPASSKSNDLKAEYLSARRIADMWGISKSTFYNRTKDAEFPKPVDMAGRTTRWSRTDLDDWLRRRQRK